MIDLHQAMADYFAVRRALGYKLIRSEKMLKLFLAFMEHKGETRITTDTALAWATSAAGGKDWAFARLSVVRRFAMHVRGLDPETEIPPTHLLRRQKRRATPYLYSPEDIARLAKAAQKLRTLHRAATLRTLIVLLSVTGMRVGEAIRLERDDFDAINGVITVRNTKFGKSREVPIHSTTVEALKTYMARRDRPCGPSSTSTVFVSETGTRLDYNCVQQTFRRLVQEAGLRQRSAFCRPRLHDLRHTFAVNTILDGYREGGDPMGRIALLSTYLGHVDPAGTYWYLSAAPELMTLVGARLERHLGGVI